MENKEITIFFSKSKILIRKDNNYEESINSCRYAK